MFPILLFCSLFCFFNCKISIFFNSCHCFLLFLSLSSFFENEFILSSMVVREFLSFPWTEFLPMELISQKDFLTLFFLLKLQPDCPPSVPSFLLWGPVLACPWNFSRSDSHQFFKVWLNYSVNNAFHDFVGVIRLPSFFHPSWHLCHLCRSFQILPWNFIIRVTVQ